MGLRYLNGERWADVTREERVFCAEAFFEIRREPNEFVRWLNGKGLALPMGSEWEAAYEVCFYRDVLARRGLPRRGSGYSLKRTFDLCLLSDPAIIIIEAKGYEPFTAHQGQHFLNDRDAVQRLVGGDVRVELVALAPSGYYKAFTRFGRGTALQPFSARISWAELADRYSNDFLRKADRLYSDRPGRLEEAEDAVPPLGGASPVSGSPAG